MKEGECMGNPVLVLGIGNTLFTDDGAPIYAVRLARRLWRGAGVDFAEVSAGGLELVQRLVGYRAAVLVDAAVTCLAQPGEIYAVRAESLPPSLSVRSYGAGLGTALAVGRSLGLDLPQRIEFLAIEAQDITTVGEIPSTEVADAIRPAAAEILRLAAALLSAVQAGVCSYDHA
jgi:hydrogenase maturation protease